MLGMMVEVAYVMVAVGEIHHLLVQCYMES